MKFSVGDRVLMKRTGEEGVITAFLSTQIIEVEVGEVKFPVYADELDHPYLKWFTDPQKRQPVRRLKEIPVEKADAKSPRLSRGIYLSFLPQFAAGSTEDIIESFHIHFLNETAEHLAYGYHARDAAGVTLLQLNGSLHPFANIFLHTLSLEEMNAQLRLYWQVAPKDKPVSGINDVLRIRPARLIRYIKDLVHEGQPAFSVLLTQDAEAIPAATQEASIITIGLAQAATPSTNQFHTGAVDVLDLHIEAVDGADEAQPSSEILRMQLSLLHRKLDAAYISGLEKMIVIHGIGNGTLRDAMHQVLRETPFVTAFSNHWMAAYGWGATAVFFGTLN